MNECGCKITGDIFEDEYAIEYCALHANAEKMRDALDAIVLLQKHSVDFCDFCYEPYDQENGEFDHDVDCPFFIAERALQELD